MSARIVVTPILAVIAVIQAIRFLQAWPVTVNGYAVPVWASAVAAVGFAILAVMVWRDRGPRRR